MSRLVWAFGRHVNGTVENLANVFEANGYTIARCDVEVPRWRKLSAMLRTLHVDSQGHLAGFSAHDPVVVQAARLPAHLAELPVLSVRDVILNESPHFFYQDLSYSTVLAQRNAGIRTFTYDDIPLTLLHRRLEVQREHYERAAHIFVFSQWLRQKMLRLDGLSPDKVHVVGAGSNLGRRWAQNPYGERNLKTPRVLFVGRDWIRKGGPLLLQAWRTVRRAIPNAELVAVGPGAAVSDPRLGITGRAPLTDDEICGLLQESSLFVMATLWEAFGVVFTEAMSAGVPVIGPRRMAVPEIIKHGETGYLVDQDEPELYAEQIIAALRDPVRLCELSEAAFARSRLFTWSRVFSRMDAVMRPIVAATDDRSADFGTS